MTEPDDPARHAAASTERAYRVLRYRDYRLLWGADFVSTLGTEVQRVAIVWQVFRLTGDPLQLGLLGLFQFAPIFLFGLVGGVIADRRDRRRTLIETQAVLLLSSAVLATVTATGAISMAIIYGVTFFAAAVNAVNGPTRNALVPALVPGRDVANAMTLYILLDQIASVSGPAVGGYLIARTGVAAAYGFDAASFLAVIAALLAIRSCPTIVEASSGGLSAALDGLRFLRASPILLGVMTVDFLATFFGAGMVLMPIFAGKILDVGAAGLGLLYAAPAAGAVVGGIVMSVARAPRRPGAGVLVAIVVYGAATAAFGLSRTFWLSLVLLALSGAADATSMALRHAIRNLITPNALRGRIAAAHSTFASGGPQLGEFESGVVASAIGAGPAIVLGGVGTVLTAAVVAVVVPAIGRYRLDTKSGAVASQATTDQVA